MLKYSYRNTTQEEIIHKWSVIFQQKDQPVKRKTKDDYNNLGEK